MKDVLLPLRAVNGWKRQTPVHGTHNVCNVNAANHFVPYQALQYSKPRDFLRLDPHSSAIWGKVPNEVQSSGQPRDVRPNAGSPYHANVGFRSCRTLAPVLPLTSWPRISTPSQHKILLRAFQFGDTSLASKNLPGAISGCVERPVRFYRVISLHSIRA